ncbi:DUF2846 domain-containing protein [Gallaecimonas mangrovi]|uniref:DUF2846 domain-containing protein n=1 Tax=Gallaecimonas mangrovi TaxID=2291597 RepID=UPI000E205425|nr:DUF2846 domain-containing protein [Gallaecimonas mangrovi]
MKKFWVFWLILAGLQGCSMDRHYAPDPSLNEMNAAVIYVYRTKNAVHGLSVDNPYFYVDDQVVGQLSPGQYVRFLVRPGRHVLSSKESFLFAPGDKSGNLSGDFLAGRRYFFRYAREKMHSGGDNAKGNSGGVAASFFPATWRMYLDKR